MTLDPQRVASGRFRVYQDDARRELQRVVAELVGPSELRRVLDAGCGYELPLDFAPDIHLVGIDIDSDALERNDNVDEKILGDVQTYPFPPESFDAVVSWWVLEHVPEPRLAIANLARALKPGGLLIVGVPHFWSLKGLLTKVTPHGFHVWVYRHLFGYADAGSGGTAPFRTYLRRDLSPRRLVRFARSQELEPVYARLHGEVPDVLPDRLRRAWMAAVKLGKIMALGFWDPSASEYIAVFRKAGP